MRIVETRAQVSWASRLPSTVTRLAILVAVVLSIALNPGTAAAVDDAFTGTWRDPAYDGSGTKWNASESALKPPLYLNKSFEIDGMEIALNVVVSDKHYFVRSNELVVAFDRTSHAELWRYGDANDNTLIEQVSLTSAGEVVVLEREFEGFAAKAVRVVVLDPAIDGNNKKKWSQTLADSLNAVMVVPPGSRPFVYVLTTGFNAQNEIVTALRALDSRDGMQEWSQPAEWDTQTSRLIYVGGTLIYGDDDILRAYSVNSGGATPLWSYTDTVSNIDVQYDLAYVRGTLLAARGDALFALDGNTGTVKWQKSPRPTGECVSVPNAYMATDGSTIGVMSFCDRQVRVHAFAEDFPILNATDSGQFLISSSQTSPIAMGNGILYVGTLPSPEAPVLRSFDSTTGELLPELDLLTDLVAYDLAIADGLLYTAGTTTGGLAGVRIYQQTPADLGVSVQLVADAACGIFTGSLVPYNVTITNSGPGTAQDVQLKTRRSPGVKDIDTSQGECGTNVVGNPFCTLGNIPAGGSAQVTLTMEIADVPAYAVEATVSSELPDPVDANNTDALSLAPTAVPDNVDLVATHLELVQAVQNLNNDAPLVAGKPTLARLHVDTGGVEVPGVTGELHATDFRGDPLPGSPLIAGNRCATLNTDGPDRSDLNQTLNFELPEEWRRGRLNLRAVVNPDVAIPETDMTNNVVDESKRFVFQPPICIKTYRVRTKNASSDDLRLPANYMRFEDEGFREQALALLPTDKIHYLPQDNLLERFIIPGGFVPYDLPDDGDLIISTLWVHDRLSFDPEFCDDANARTLHFGMVHPATPGNTNGSAFPYGDQFWVRLRTGAGDGNLNDDPRGGITLAHEIGHVFRRDHVECGGPDYVDADYPYDPCTLDDAPIDDPTSFFGLDLSNGIVMTSSAMITPTTMIAPNAAADLMSYGNSRWVSDYTWKGLGNGICRGDSLTLNLLRDCSSPEFQEEEDAVAATAATAAVSRATGEEVLLVTGVVDSGGAIELNELLRLPQDQVPPNKLAEAAPITDTQATHVLALLDAADSVLLEQPFAATPVAEGDGLFIGLTVPWQAGTTKIVVRNVANSQSTTEAVSASVPTVTVTSPNGGETIGGDSMKVSWTANDADGDTLSFILQYSRDNGQSWEVLATYVGGLSYTADVSLLGGSQQARLRVIASDGVNSASDESDGPFAVSDKSPLVEISQPSDGANLPGGSALILRGSGYDAEDGPLEASALTWTVSGQGEIGKGTDQTLYDLPDGEYTITLTATDSAQQVATEMITVRIATPALREVPLPDDLPDNPGDDASDGDRLFLPSLRG